MHVRPITKLGDCYDFFSSATLDVKTIGDSALASDNPTWFDTSPAIEPASAAEIRIVKTGLLQLGPQKVRSSAGLRIRSVRLERNVYYLAERHSTSHHPYGIAFAIGRIVSGKFEILRWNDNGGEDGDTVETALGAVRLVNGREFLLTMETNPEGRSYYVYGIQQGRLQIVFRGGGSSC